MDRTLNELQTAILLLEQVQSQISQIGSSVQSISQFVEEFISEQKSQEI
ncbi:hypothetical protein [Scytonema sp. NUACC26]